MNIEEAAKMLMDEMDKLPDNFRLSIAIEDTKGHMMTRINRGFNALELIGAYSTFQADMIGQMRGLIEPPTVIKRHLIVDENKEE